MPIKVPCPLCKTEVSVSRDAQGTRVTCPWCHHRFRVEQAQPASDADAPMAVPPTLKQPPGGKGPGKDKPATPGDDNSETNGGQGGEKPPAATPAEGRKAKLRPESIAKLSQSGQTSQPESRPQAPTEGGKAAGKSGPAAKAPQAKTPSQMQRPGAQSPNAAPPPSKSARPPTEDRDAPARPASQPPARKPPDAGAGQGRAAAQPASAPAPAEPKPPEKKVARLILTEPSPTQWKLGADGDLPNLRLKEENEPEEKREKPSGSNPLLLFILVGVSVVVSIMLLMVDLNPQEGAGVDAKARARQIIAQEYYTNLNPDEPLQPYQVYLREAQWAHSRGDARTEREMYQKVLKLLFAQDDEFRGLTGSRDRDRRLEEQLRILLQP